MTRADITILPERPFVAVRPYRNQDLLVESVRALRKARGHLRGGEVTEFLLEMQRAAFRLGAADSSSSWKRVCRVITNMSIRAGDVLAVRVRR